MRYQVQTLWLDEVLALVGLDLEPLIGLAARIERAFAPRQVMVFGYAPDSTELARGGCETTSYLAAPWLGPIAGGVEQSLLPRLYVD